MGAKTQLCLTTIASDLDTVLKVRVTAYLALMRYGSKDTIRQMANLLSREQNKLMKAFMVSYMEAILHQNTTPLYR